jgi:hypothetical protein
MVGSGHSFVNLYVPCFRMWLNCQLLSAICCCRLYFLQFTGGSCHTHLVQQALFILSSLGCLPLQCRVLPAWYSWSPCLFRVLAGNCPSPTLRQGVLHISYCYEPCPPQAHWWELPNPLSLAGLFICSSSGCLPLPISLELKAPRPLCYMSSVVCLLLS